MKTKTKKDKKAAEDGFELWNELEVQRIKFMVSSPLLQTLQIFNFMLLATTWCHSLTFWHCKKC